MTSFKDSLLPVVESIRGIPGQLGLRVFTVAGVVTKTYSGPRIGQGSVATTEVDLSVAFGMQPPKVRQLSQEDIVRSGGELETVQFEIGPVTPNFAGGGFAYSVFEPVTTSSLTEVFFRIVGPGTQTDGDWFVKTSAKRDRPFRFMVTVKKTAARPA